MGSIRETPQIARAFAPVTSDGLPTFTLKVLGKSFLRNLDSGRLAFFLVFNSASANALGDQKPLPMKTMNM